MHSPYTYTGLYIALWDTWYYGMPGSITVYGSNDSVWTEIGSKTYAGAYDSDTIPLFY